MGCPNDDCGSSTPAGSGTQVITNPTNTCSDGAFCDDKLSGLPVTTSGDILSVPAGDKCAHRLIGASPGVYQYDPTRPGGSGFVGPLAALRAAPADKMGDDECGYLPILRDVTPAGGDPQVEVAAQDVLDVNIGDLSVLQKCTGGKTRVDRLDPVAFDADNPCEANLTLLGYVLQTVISGSRQSTKKLWKAITRLILPATQVTELTADPDYTGDSYRRPVWKKVGTCWELTAAPKETAPSCSDYTSTGGTFPYLIACKNGEQQKVEPTAGKILRGDGSNWQLTTIGPAMGTPVNIFSQTGTQPTAATQNVDLTTIAGYNANATHVILNVSAYGIVTSQDYVATISINGVRYLRIVVVAAYGSDTNDNQVIVPIPADKTLAIAVGYTVGAPGTSSTWEAKVDVAGYLVF